MSLVFPRMEQLDHSRRQSIATQRVHVSPELLIWFHDLCHLVNTVRGGTCCIPISLVHPCFPRLLILIQLFSGVSLVSCFSNTGIS